VPEDRAKPNGMKVHLPVTRAPARLAGALGAPTIDLCGCEDIANSLARDHSELVHLGARGYDGSPQLKCPEFVTARLAALTKPSNDSQELAAATDGLRQCHARLVKSGIDPAQFNDAVAARDVLDLMWALHFTRANFVAFQESAVQAFALVREAPGAVRSLTLDNPPPPGDTTFTSPISDFSGAFDRFVAACRADHSCAGAYPDLAAQYRAAYQNAERSPQLVTGTASWDPKPRQVLLDGPRIADSLANALNNSDALPAIPAAITQPTGAVEAGIVLYE
jgi:pimeloyl-ACP methyl ester carboxylesterase